MRYSRATRPLLCVRVATGQNVAAAWSRDASRYNIRTISLVVKGVQQQPGSASGDSVVSQGKCFA